MSEEMLHLCGPLGMRCAAQSETVCEHSGPVFACAQIPFGKTGAPQIFRAFFTVREMCIAPRPRCERLVLIRLRKPSDHPSILIGLGCEELCERRTGQLPWIPWVIRANLRITD